MRNAIVLLLLLAACTADPPVGRAGGPLRTAFEEAAREQEVPEPLLLAIGWVESRWHTPSGVEDRHTEDLGARGLMGVLERPDQPRLSEAAKKLGVQPSLAEKDAATNIHTAAIVLRDLALETLGRIPPRIEDWRPVVARYGSPDDDLTGAAYATDVFAVLQQGAEGIAEGDEPLLLEPIGKLGEQFGQTRNALTGGVDFPGAKWVPAKWDHFQYGRTSAITHIIIHTTEGSYNSAISWFRSPSNPWKTSAHYVVRSSDGEVTQMVRESDTAHHIGGWNPFTIGIEHEAMAGEGHLWFTEAMLRTSAAITRAACLRYGIPMDRNHIRGHVEVPGASHWDPGPYFPWDYYMSLVRDPNITGGPGVSNPCGGLDYAGECQGSTLRWCENGVTREVSCAASGKSCGWQDTTVGYNCLEGTPADPCGGLDYAGECQGSTLRWCEGGAIRTFDCSTQGETCGWEDASVGNNCIPGAPVDPCGGLDYAGECQGTTLRWCESGTLRTHDCSTQGQSCGWQDDNVGNNCVPTPAPSECEQLGYAGECNGDVLRWCENGQVQTYDCSESNKGCGWQDANVGHNCLYTCASLGYAGTCDGDTLRWCENGSMRTQACSALGKSCGWQSEAVGYNCL